MGVAGLEREMSPEELLASARTACGHAQGAGGGRRRWPLVSGRSRPAGGPREAVEALAVALTERDRYTGDTPRR